LQYSEAVKTAFLPIENQGKVFAGDGLDAAPRMIQIRWVNVQALKMRVSGGGFRPFAIRTTDGQEFEIPHPEFILIGKFSIAILDKRGFINNIDPLHVVSARELSRRDGGS
jgi:hypothetical protein